MLSKRILCLKPFPTCLFWGWKMMPSSGRNWAWYFRKQNSMEIRFALKYFSQPLWTFLWAAVLEIRQLCETSSCPTNPVFLLWRCRIEDADSDKEHFCKSLFVYGLPLCSKSERSHYYPVWLGKCKRLCLPVGWDEELVWGHSGLELVMYKRMKG